MKRGAEGLTFLRQGSEAHLLSVLLPREETGRERDKDEKTSKNETTATLGKAASPAGHVVGFLTEWLGGCPLRQALL